MRDVETLVEELAERDDAGLVVAACWYDVSNDRPNYLMSQLDVQNFLWLTLPQLLREPPADVRPMPDWRDVVKRAAWFFDQLDQPRYADICRSERTAKIIEAAGDEMGCFELYAHATLESGLMPPADMRVAWTDEPGPRETALFDAITRALERAIVAGDLDPADDQRRLGVAVDVLDQSPDGHHDTLGNLLLTERMELWRDHCGSQTMRELLVRTAPDFAGPSGLDADLLMPAVRPLARVVGEPGAGPGEVRRIAEKFGLLETVDGELRRTDDGDRAIAHPVMTFEAMCNGLLDSPDRIARQAVAPLFAMLLLADEIDLDMMVERIGMVLYEMGWRGDAHDEPMPTDTVRDTVLDLLQDLQTVGATENGERLTAFGRELIHGAIRMHAMQGGSVE
ncbi:MAG: hypothetical protein GEV28_27395 [Actinophytocola sp.]|uniref:hypothetical protein n=1 Tax=Actinophytocola sp. TaxID=1872138 RepID=UPI00132BE23E|nr:hypothetical protein [Actinophytocola sp.]MPZ83915.1 hypothetical protein [Actinophytocola sp.]